MPYAVPQQQSYSINKRQYHLERIPLHGHTSDDCAPVRGSHARHRILLVLEPCLGKTLAVAGTARIRQTIFRSPHRLPVDLLDRVFVVSTEPYTKEDIEQTIQIRYVQDSFHARVSDDSTGAQKRMSPLQRSYECLDIHGHANDTAVLLQPHILCPDAGSETKGGTSGRGGSALGVYGFHE